MSAEIDAWEVDQAGRNTLFVNHHDIKETVVDFRFWSKVHAATCKCPIRYDDSKEVVTHDTYAIYFNGYELLTVSGCGRNSGDSKPQKSPHPFVMGQKALDDYGGNALRTFI